MSDFIDSLTQILDEAGIHDWRVDDKGKHLKLYVTVDGDERFLVVSRSPSDRRAQANAISDLRRLAGIERVIVKNHERRRRRAAAPRPRTKPQPDLVRSAGERIAPKENPFEKLRELMRQSPADVGQAG